MAGDELNQDLPEYRSPWEPSAADESPAADEPTAAEVPEFPERLRVHSLARVLGTTSKRVLDALTALDGRARSAQSSVDQAEALRVRDVLAAEPAGDAAVVPATEIHAEILQTAAEQAPEEATGAVIEENEPESRLILETPDFGEPTGSAIEHAAYLPLFVAPRAVVIYPEVDADRDSDSADELADDAADDDSADDADDETPGRPANRRRRRGRRGRGRGRGEPAVDADDDAEDRVADDENAEGGSETGEPGETGEDGDDEADEEGAGSEGATRRRRRRRRRKTGGNDDSAVGSTDDPPNTVVHERAPRDKADRDAGEIQGISGSTRLEAKRQRRRDGRDAGRRRPPILTEAEFLARREAVNRVMVVRDKVRAEQPHQGARYTQIAVLEDGIVVEHFVTSAGSASLVGNIYLGIVQNVLPSMEAAFVDIGRGRNGVLYAGEVNWEAAGLGGANRKIEQALKPGDYVVVQVSKDPVGHKGARLTTQVSLAGRYLVYVPGASSTGISRKLPDTERQRLKDILREVVPTDAGVIIRTASEGVKEDEIRGDVTRLQERWGKIAEEAERVKGNKAGAAVALYEEPDVLVKVVRDLFNEDFSGLIVSGDSAWGTITSYVDSVAPELLSKLTKYEPTAGPDGPDVFAVHRIDEQLAKAMDRKVWLPSGGTLVIDRTEAMTVVDVNTGKFTGAGGNLEQTVTKNNLEAAEEIVRQLRLRDIGGIVVIDFIDMVLESNRDLVLRRLTEALARDRTRHQVSEVTSLGLVQLTRKKLGTGLIEAFSTSCAECAGRGIVLHSDPVENAVPAAARKAEPSNRRNRRGRKGRAEEPAVARVPVHTPGEHPMFRAMAAAKGGDEDEEGFDEAFDEAEDFGKARAAFDGEAAREIADELSSELVDDDELAEDELADDAEDDEDDEDDEDIDDDEGEDEDDEDIEDDEGEDEDDEDIELDEVDEDVIDDDAIEEDESLEIVDDDDDEDLDDDEAEDDEIVEVSPPPSVFGRLRRRAAVRPAGPPAAER